MERLVYSLYRLVAGVLARVPLRAVFFLGGLLGSLTWWLARPYRRLVTRNLALALGDALSERERLRLGRMHFCRLFANLGAGARLGRMSLRELKAVVTIEGLEGLKRVCELKQGAVVVLSHMSNWELLAQLIPQIVPCACGAVYQRLSNSLIDASVREARARDGMQLFERKAGFHGAMELLRSGGIVGVLSDQHAGDSGVWCPFFGRLASTSPLAATMAMRTGAALVSGAVFTEPGGRWRIVFSEPVAPVSKDIGEVTAQVNRMIEKPIREAPADWLWAHNRWKTPKPAFLTAKYKRGSWSGGITSRFRLLVRSTNWLGDAVMTVPAVRSMKRSRPDLHLTVAVAEKLADFWRAVPEVDEVLPLSKEDGIWGAARRMRAGDFDAVVVFPNSLRSGLEARLAGIPRRVGYAGHSRAWLLNQVLPESAPPKRPAPDAAPKHQVYRYLRLAEWIGAVPLPEPEWVQRLALPPGAGDSRPWRIGVCPGAEFGPAKRWFPESFAEVMRAFSQERRTEWHLVGVGKDAEAGAVIESRFGEARSGASAEESRVRNWIGKTTLSELIALLRQCDALLTNDTGTMHLAAMLGVPVVAVFGSTDPLLTGPLGQGYAVVQHRVPCGPCFQRECHTDFACMRKVSPEEVFAALKRVLLLPPA